MKIVRKSRCSVDSAGGTYLDLGSFFVRCFFVRDSCWGGESSFSSASEGSPISSASEFLSSPTAFPLPLLFNVRARYAFSSSESFSSSSSDSLPISTSSSTTSGTASGFFFDLTFPGLVGEEVSFSVIGAALTSLALCFLALISRDEEAASWCFRFNFPDFAESAGTVGVGWSMLIIRTSQYQ